MWMRSDELSEKQVERQHVYVHLRIVFYFRALKFSLSPVGWLRELIPM